MHVGVAFVEKIRNAPGIPIIRLRMRRTLPRVNENIDPNADNIRVQNSALLWINMMRKDVITTEQ
jgi:hypothetical protein